MNTPTCPRFSFKELIVALLLLIPFSAVAEQVTSEAAPRDMVVSTVDSLVKIVAENSGDDATSARRAKMREVIAPLFDFGEMSKRSLGHNWLKMPENQRTEFVDLFSELLANTYLKRLENIEEGMVTVGKEQQRSNKALVKTTVNYKGDKFPIDYKMVRRQAGWRVYDVVIENIGLVTNYRNEFSGIVRKEKFEGLLKRLRSRSEKEKQAS